MNARRTAGLPGHRDVRARWGVACIVCTLAGLPAAARAQTAPTTEATSGRLTLKGTVTAEDGTPIRGALAMISTASVRRGTSPY